jgi:peroxiredoxin
MKKRLITTLATVFLMLSMAAGVFSAENPKAPDFTLQDMNGKSVSLNSFKGKNVLLYFTTTWCPYCKREVPELKEMHQKYKGRLEILAIDMNESKAKVSSYIEKYQIPYTTLLDSDGSVGIDYSVRGVPTAVLVGKDGRVFCYMCRNLPNQVEELLRKK